jgi:hypothetical protein
MVRVSAGASCASQVSNGFELSSSSASLREGVYKISLFPKLHSSKKA